jgi:hypothetical protein
MSKLDDIIQEHGEAWLRSQTPYKPNEIAKQQIIDLFLELMDESVHEAYSGSQAIELFHTKVKSL